MSFARDLLETQNRLVELETQELALPRVIEAVFVVSGIADNTATDVFRIETTDESGSTDAGTYAVYMHFLVTHAAGSTASNNAAKSLTCHYVRAVKNDGTGVNGLVSEISETASAATTSATRDLSTVTVTVQENTEYSNDIQITIDLTGSGVATAHVVCYTRLLWQGFLTSPVLTQL